MAIIHFLNVGNGDCSFIEHDSGRNTIIDICCGNNADNLSETIERKVGGNGNYRQKDYPINPIRYFCNIGIRSIFRFILTHPDMDHMDGIYKLYKEFRFENFWDTKNNKIINNFDDRRYLIDDWNFYQSIRKKESNPKIIYNYAMDEGNFWTDDGLTILAPSLNLVSVANKTQNYNNCSYVILFNNNGRRIIFAGDSGQESWDYILNNYDKYVRNIDILIAPHHGRRSGGNDKYLDILNPKLSLLGNAESEYMDYNAWNNRNLCHMTNNQAGSIKLVINNNGEILVYISNKLFAENYNSISDGNGWWFIGKV